MTTHTDNKTETKKAVKNAALDRKQQEHRALLDDIAKLKHAERIAVAERQIAKQEDLLAKLEEKITVATAELAELNKAKQDREGKLSALDNKLAELKKV